MSQQIWLAHIVLTAPVTQDDLGKARVGQVQCWPRVILIPAHLLKRNCSNVLMPLASLCTCCDGLVTGSMYPSIVVLVFVA